MAITEHTSAYGRVEELLAGERCVMLDGGMGTELGRHMPAAERAHEEALWGTWALVRNPHAVKAVHARLHRGRLRRDLHQHVGRAQRDGRRDLRARTRRRCTGWTSRGAASASAARRSPRPAAQGETALAFSINGDVDSDARQELLELLPRAFEDDPPDLILLETITLVRNGLTLGAIEALVESGIPVWVSFRRCRHGVCGVFGQHWGGPEGDEFGRMARRFEEIGVKALLINCLPPDHVPGCCPGCATSPTCRSASTRTSATDRRRLELRPDVGGDGVRRPRRAAGARRARRSSAAAAACGPSTSRPPARACATCRPATATASSAARPAGHARRPASRRRPRGPGPTTGPPPLPARDARDRLRPGRFVPTQGSYLVWKHLFRERHRRGQALHRHRLRHRPAGDPARAQRRRARARDRHRPPRGREHARQRGPQRRGRPDHRRGDRPLPLGAEGALRRGRREPLPDAGRPLRRGQRATGRSTSGAATCSTT